jgi:hypothetical protein
MTALDEHDGCDQCQECPGCGCGSGADPRSPVLDFSRPGVVMLLCGDCGGSGFVCPTTRAAS